MASAAFFLALTGGAYAVAGNPFVARSGAISVCVQPGDNELHAVRPGTQCPSGDVALRLNQKGLRGRAGRRGATGLQGAAGAIGASGPQGTKGDTGAAGATGPPGPQGAKGDTGAAGARGRQDRRGLRVCQEQKAMQDLPEQTASAYPAPRCPQGTPTVLTAAAASRRPAGRLMPATARPAHLELAFSSPRRRALADQRSARPERTS